jgi:hypothetical protein
MHIIYRIYSFMCSAHFAVSVLVLALGYQPQAPVHANATVPLSSAYFAGSMASSAFSMAYLTLADEEARFQGGEYTQQELLADLLFWAFLAAQTFVTLGCTTQRAGPVEQLYLRYAVRLGASYLICSPLEKRRGPNLAASAAFVAVLGLGLWDAALVRTQPVLTLLYLHRFLELLLYVGHRWDGEPPVELLLNCRVCYVALGGALLHADMVVAASM